MQRVLWGTFAAALIVGTALPVEAGRRHCRSCSTSSSSGRPAGGWYHFTSGSGSYIPFAPQTVATSYADPVYGQTVTSDCGRPARYSTFNGPAYHTPTVQRI